VFTITYDGATVTAADTRDLHLSLSEIRNGARGTLKGVIVKYNNKRVTKDKLGEIAMYYLNNPDKLKIGA
jgi:hypothetical protein